MSSRVFSGLVGQEQAISALDRAIQASNNGADQAMTHAGYSLALLVRGDQIWPKLLPLPLYVEKKGVVNAQIV